jgi:hypothetical protein
MRKKSGAEQSHVSQGLPHSSWNLDRPILFSQEPADGDSRASEQRKITPEEIWAVVDAAS